MTDENLDAEGTQPSDTSSDEETTEEVSEDEKTPSGEEAIPYSRFKEVVDSKNELKSDLNSIKEELENLKTAKEAEEEEPLDWKEAEKRTINKAVRQIKEDLQKKAEEDVAREKVIEQSFSQLSKMGAKITADVKKSVLTEMIRTGDKNVIDTYLNIKDKVDDRIRVNQQKKEGYVPISKKGSDADIPTFDYKNIRGKSVDDIIEESGL